MAKKIEYYEIKDVIGLQYNYIECTAAQADELNKELEQYEFYNPRPNCRDDYICATRPRLSWSCRPALSDAQTILKRAKSYYDDRITKSYDGPKILECTKRQKELERLRQIEYEKQIALRKVN